MTAQTGSRRHWTALAVCAASSLLVFAFGGSSSAAPRAAPTLGVIDTWAMRPKQRVFSDGRLVGFTPARIRLKCGRRTIKIGRAAPIEIDVPCGGEVELDTHGNPVVEATADAGAPDGGARSDLSADGGLQDGGEEAPPPSSGLSDAGAEAPVEPPPAPRPPVDGTSALGGRVFAYVRAPLVKPLEAPIQQASASAWLESRPRFNETTSAAFSISIDAQHSAFDQSEVRLRVREAYAAASSDGWEVRFGQQLIAWGNADIINPTDFLGARDFSFFAVENETRRLGNVYLWGSWTPAGGTSPFQLNLVWTPVVTPSRFALPAAALAGATMGPFQTPPLTLGNSEGGVRAVYRGNGWDVAAVGFRGYNHTPEFVFVSATPAGVTLAQRIREIRAVGGEASFTADVWIFRAEGAYSFTENDSGLDPTSQPSNFHGVVGIERPFGERLRGQLQGIVRYNPALHQVRRSANPNPLLAALEDNIARINALLLGYSRLVLPSTSLRLVYRNGENPFEAEGVVLVSVDTSFRVERLSYLVRPLLSYHASDALKFSLGLEYYGGAGDTPFGFLRSYSGAFFGGDYRF